MILTFRPIEVWPEGFNRTHLDRQPSPFRAGYRETLTLLDRELHALGATDPILQVDAEPGDVRIDGQLRANAVVRHPGAILSFDTSSHGTLVYATDLYPHWRANLRAIALGLEALRKVERYGIAGRGQQYAGYRQLGTGVALGPAPLTVEQAAEMLATGHPDLAARILSGDVGLAKALYKELARRLHPDMEGGDADAFRRATEARDLILETIHQEARTA